MQERCKNDSRSDLGNCYLPGQGLLDMFQHVPTRLMSSRKENGMSTGSWVLLASKLHLDTKWLMIVLCYIQVYTWWLLKIPLSANGHSSKIKTLLSRNCRELHVYLSRGPCWATTPLMKIRSPPAKLRQRITDHFLKAFLNTQLASRSPFSGQIVAD